jgi:small subunit ribosomal protein S25
MKGKAPIRRTLKFLEAGSLVLKDRVKVFCVNYNHHGDHHKGAKYVFCSLTVHVLSFGGRLRCMYIVFSD